VVTRTAEVHAAAWKSVLDEVLAVESARTGRPLAPFDPVDEYRSTVDGRPRAEGVRAFLAARGIDRPEADADRTGDVPVVTDGHGPLDSVEAIARAKDRAFRRLVASGGVPVHAGAVALVRALRAAGVATAVVSASENARQVLEAAGLAELFDVRVDGLTARQAALAGKPAPDTYREAARRLGVDPARCVVVEDALVGVDAGRAGGFGLVIGVAGPRSADRFRSHGADLVVEHLGALLGRDELGLGHRHHRWFRTGGRVGAGHGR
jgi:HAD superfamily hydrolase (TIGR01509 family)